jgi:lipopolysaccharide biosynthesis glycosyltransferase
MSNPQCIVYVADLSFFFPTFVSACQARKWCRTETDVVIVLTERPRDRETLSGLCTRAGIIFLNGSETLEANFSRLSSSDFSHRISKAAMGRLLVCDILPSQYQQITYIDGDTQIFSSLEKLEAFEVPTGRFLASPDYVGVHDYLSGMPLGRSFNSGVLKLNRTGWVGPEAFEYYVTHGGKLHDQGALNACGKDALMLMSCNWNFPKQFLHKLDGARPPLVHFMAHPKPWDGVFFPWGRDEYEIYSHCIEEFPELRKFRARIEWVRKAVYKFRSIKNSIRARKEPQGERIRDLLDPENFTETNI